MDNTIEVREQSGVQVLSLQNPTLFGEHPVLRDLWDAVICTFEYLNEDKEDNIFIENEIKRYQTISLACRAHENIPFEVKDSMFYIHTITSCMCKDYFWDLFDSLSGIYNCFGLFACEGLKYFSSHYCFILQNEKGYYAVSCGNYLNSNLTFPTLDKRVFNRLTDVIFSNNLKDVIHSIERLEGGKNRWNPLY